MQKLLLIFGEKATASEMEELVQTHFADSFSEARKVYFEDGFWERKEFSPYKKEDAWEIHYLIGVNDIDIRRACIQTAESLHFRPWSLIHPQSYIAPSAQIGPGCYIAANASISTGARLGPHVQVNFNASVGHDAQVAANSLILPGARISGNVNIGPEVLIGSNAFVFQGLSIGEGSRIDALTYVNQDVPAGMICSTRKMQMFKRIDQNG